MLQLLIDMAVDFDEPICFDNPLRQVIINTHSAAVVQQVPENSLLIADFKQTRVDGKKSKRVRFRYLADTWRDDSSDADRLSKTIPKGDLLTYLNPVPRNSDNNNDTRVIDRPDLQFLMP